MLKNNKSYLIWWKEIRICLANMTYKLINVRGNDAFSSGHGFISVAIESCCNYTILYLI